MEKRTLIAFALMILVWILFTQLMPQPERAPREATPPGESATQTSDRDAITPTPSEPPLPTAADESSALPGARTEDRRGDTGARDARPRAELVNVLEADEREVVIEGPLYTAIFSTRGGVIHSWRLNDYTDAIGEPVELVQQMPGALGLRIDGPEGEIDLRHTVFTLEESVDVEPAPETGSPTELRVLRFIAEVQIGQGSPLRVERTYRIDPLRYDIHMDVAVGGVDNQRNDHELVIGWERGIPNLEKQVKLEHGAKGAVAMLAEEMIQYNFGGGRPGCGCGGGPASEGGEREYEGQIRWAGVRGKYFGAILVPQESFAGTFIGQSQPEADAVGMRLAMPLEYSGTSRYRFTLYAGPIDYTILKDLEARLQADVDRLVDFGGKLIAPLSKATYWFMDTVHSVVPNYGLVIIILALAVRLLFHPLNQRAIGSQRKMQALKPLMDEINKKYKDNPEQRTKKTMELYKQQGINPLGGCLPILVQLPVFYGLYNVLMNTIKLRKEPFVLWMQDLATPDKVGEVMGIPIHILPILMALTMFVQQKMTPTDPRQAPLMLMMPLMMVFFFYGLPSGLVLYWTMSNVLALAQQLMMKPPVLVAATPTAEEAPRPKKFGRKRG